jgi:hypothetical protein
MTPLTELMIRYECAAWALVELEQQDADPAIIRKQQQHCRELRRQMMMNVPECETIETELTVEWIK